MKRVEDHAGIYDVWTIIPAAGRSRRMRRFKPLLPWVLLNGGKGTVIEAVVEKALTYVSGNVVVVVGHNSNEIRRVLHRFPIHILVNRQPDAPMGTSVSLAMTHVPLNAHILLWPGDHPAVAGESIKILMKKHIVQPEKIHGLVYDGRHGHPTLFPARVRVGLEHPDPKRGVRALLTDDTFPVEWIPVSDPGVRVNLDYPEDYEQAYMNMYNGMLREG